jgi:hypothetical protein
MLLVEQGVERSRTTHLDAGRCSRLGDLRFRGTSVWTIRRCMVACVKVSMRTKYRFTSIQQPIPTFCRSLLPIFGAPDARTMTAVRRCCSCALAASRAPSAPARPPAPRLANIIRLMVILGYVSGS